MRGLTNIEISENQNVMRIAAEKHWARVYEKLHSLGLEISGGRAAKIGVGGFILGDLLFRCLHRAVFVTDWRNAGGLSLFSTRRDFVCDSVVNFEIVLASGDIVNANSTENKDLWLALREGENNFDIVTRFDMSVFPQGEMWEESIIYDISSSSQLFQALYNFVVDPTHDTATHFIWSEEIAQRFKTVMSNMYYSKSEPNPPTLQEFTAIQPQLPAMNTLRIDSLMNFANEQTTLSINELRWVFSVSSSH
jgi:FAD/FMN-containing dehydrogenase